MPEDVSNFQGTVFLVFHHHSDLVWRRTREGYDRLRNQQIWASDLKEENRVLLAEHHVRFRPYEIKTLVLYPEPDER